MELLKRISAVLVVLVLLASVSYAQDDDDNKIVLVENPWTASAINVNVAKVILEQEFGYEVEIVLLEESAQWVALASGDVDASLEVWPSGHQANVAEYIDELGVVVNGGLLGPVGKIGWFIPTYLLDEYPELATWEGFLDPEMAQLFATAETGDKGQYLAGAPGWVQYDEQIISNLGLNLQVVYAGSEEAILAAVTAAYRREEPVLFYFWTPHSIHAELDLTNVALPEYTEECYASVAEDEAVDVACDYPADELFKIFAADLEERAPEAFNLLSNMNYSSEVQIEMIAAVDVDGLTPEEAAQAWVEENEDLWREWLKSPEELAAQATAQAEATPEATAQP